MDYRYTNAVGEDDDLYELDLTAGANRMDGRNLVSDKKDRKDGGAFEEDGDAGAPSVFQSTRSPAVSNSRPNLDTPVPAASPPFIRPAVAANASDSTRGNVRRMPATSTMPPTYPSPSSVPTILNSFKKWSLDTFKYTKQYVTERFGNTPRTVDPETEARVEALRETQRQYLNILRLSRTLHLHFQRMVQTQRVLGDAFGDLSQKNTELSEQFAYNSETQKLLSRNGEVLLGVLNVFMTSLATLCNTTIEDTLTTVKNYEAARIKYDADRLYLESVRLQTRDAVAIAKAQEAERIFLKTKQRFDRLHNDLIIKLRFLDENKVSVCQKHLYLLHKGFISYVAGNREGVEEVLRHVQEMSRQVPAVETKVTPTTGSSPDLNPNASPATSLPADECRVVTTDACHAASSDVCHLPNE